MRAAVEATRGWDNAFQEHFFRERFMADANQIIVVDSVDASELKP